MANDEGVRMRFTQRYSHEIGETRRRKGFLWIPRQAGRDIRWLEIAEWEEVIVYKPGNIGGVWETTKWLTK